MKNIKNEKLFVRFSGYPHEKTQTGRQQFFDSQSFGIFPTDPDPYYICLTEGKKQFDMQCSELRKMYLGQTEWWGLYQLWLDWEGERWVLPYLCKWHSNLPDWIDKEQKTLNFY